MGLSKYLIGFDALIVLPFLLLIWFSHSSQQNINQNLDQSIDDNNKNNQNILSDQFKSIQSADDHQDCSHTQLSQSCDNSTAMNRSETSLDGMNTTFTNNKTSQLTDQLSQTNDNLLSDSLSVPQLPLVPTPAPPNEMLSFEEWRKKIAEQQLASHSVSTKPLSQSSAQSTASQPSASASTGQVTQTNKMSISKRARNFASYECGAKVVDANPEAESVLRILNEQTDEYMLNPCKAKIWFVVELCETIQPKTIELANFELYSSIPKEFNIQASDHYPTRDWSSLGTFNAADERSVQRFQLHDNGFVKFIKIEMLSHYGSEHFCPLSVVRIFGTSLFEEVERIDNIAHGQAISDEDDDSPLNEQLIGEDASAQNLFGTARDAVFNIVRKAAQALNGNTVEVTENNRNETISSEFSAIRLESTAIKLYPKLSEYLQSCNGSNNFNRTIMCSKKCLYFKSLLGNALFDLLCQQYLTISSDSQNTNQRLLFQCRTSVESISENLINIEPSIDPKFIEPISPTDSMLANSENISSSKSNSIDYLQEIKTIITETIVGQTTSIEATISPTITLESSSNEAKYEQSSTIAVIKDNDHLNGSQTTSNSSAPAKVEEIAKNLTQNEAPSPQTGQTVNGNGHIGGSSVSQSKESVVLRLSNRIKALEVNLSLSSQYLEELSLRYRKQMEEMQRAFDITINKLNDTASQAAEKDLKQQESIRLMESKLNTLNDKMLLVLSERESLNWHYIEVHIGLMMIEVIIVIALLFICVYRLSARIRYLQTNQIHNQSILGSIHPKISHSLSPIKRLHPNHNVCHLPAKTLKIEDQMKNVDSSANNNLVNVQRKIRKKKKKGSGNATNNLFGPQTGPDQNSIIATVNQNQSSLVLKSQSTPVLTNGIFNNQTNSYKSGSSSCHSSTSGVSSISALSNSNVFNPESSKLLPSQVDLNKKYSNQKLMNSKKPAEKSSLSFSLKRLLKIEHK